MIPKKQFKLLVKIFNTYKCFDKRDNSFIVSNRGIAKYLGISPSSVDQLFRTLRNDNLIKEIEFWDHSKRWMLMPELLHRRHSPDYFYNKGLFHLGSHTNCISWIDSCFRVNRLLDPATGEIKDHELENEMDIKKPIDYFDVYRQLNLIFYAPKQSSKPHI